METDQSETILDSDSPSSNALLAPSRQSSPSSSDNGSDDSDPSPLYDAWTNAMGAIEAFRGANIESEWNNFEPINGEPQTSKANVSMSLQVSQVSAPSGNLLSIPSPTYLHRNSSVSGKAMPWWQRIVLDPAFRKSVTLMSTRLMRSLEEDPSMAEAKDDPLSKKKIEGSALRYLFSKDVVLEHPVPRMAVTEQIVKKGYEAYDEYRRSGALTRQAPLSFNSTVTNLSTVTPPVGGNPLSGHQNYVNTTCVRAPKPTKELGALSPSSPTSPRPASYSPFQKEKVTIVALKTAVSRFSHLALWRPRALPTYHVPLSANNTAVIAVHGKIDLTPPLKEAIAAHAARRKRREDRGHARSNRFYQKIVSDAALGSGRRNHDSDSEGDEDYWLGRSSYGLLMFHHSLGMLAVPDTLYSPSLATSAMTMIAKDPSTTADGTNAFQKLKQRRDKRLQMQAIEAEAEKDGWQVGEGDGGSASVPKPFTNVGEEEDESHAAPLSIADVFPPSGFVVEHVSRTDVYLPQHLALSQPNTHDAKKKASKEKDQPAGYLDKRPTPPLPQLATAASTFCGASAEGDWHFAIAIHEQKDTLYEAMYKHLKDRHGGVIVSQEGQGRTKPSAFSDTALAQAVAAAAVDSKSSSPTAPSSPTSPAFGLPFDILVKRAEEVKGALKLAFIDYHKSLLDYTRPPRAPVAATRSVLSTVCAAKVDYGHFLFTQKVFEQPIAVIAIRKTPREVMREELGTAFDEEANKKGQEVVALNAFSDVPTTVGYAQVPLPKRYLGTVRPSMRLIRWHVLNESIHRCYKEEHHRLAGAAMPKGKEAEVSPPEERPASPKFGVDVSLQQRKQHLMASLSSSPASPTTIGGPSADELCQPNAMLATLAGPQRLAYYEQFIHKVPNIESLIIEHGNTLHEDTTAPSAIKGGHRQAYTLPSATAALTDSSRLLPPSACGMLSTSFFGLDRKDLTVSRHDALYRSGACRAIVRDIYDHLEKDPLDGHLMKSAFISFVLDIMNLFMPCMRREVNILTAEDEWAIFNKSWADGSSMAGQAGGSRPQSGSLYSRTAYSPMPFASGEGSPAKGQAAKKKSPTTSSPFSGTASPNAPPTVLHQPVGDGSKRFITSYRDEKRDRQKALDTLADWMVSQAAEDRQAATLDHESVFHTGNMSVLGHTQLYLPPSDNSTKGMQRRGDIGPIAEANRSGGAGDFIQFYNFFFSFPLMLCQGEVVTERLYTSVWAFVRECCALGARGAGKRRPTAATPPSMPLSPRNGSHFAVDGMHSASPFAGSLSLAAATTTTADEGAASASAGRSTVSGPVGPNQFRNVDRYGEYLLNKELEGAMGLVDGGRRALTIKRIADRISRQQGLEADREMMKAKDPAADEAAAVQQSITATLGGRESPFRPQIVPRVSIIEELKAASYSNTQASSGDGDIADPLGQARRQLNANKELFAVYQSSPDECKNPVAQAAYSAYSTYATPALRYKTIVEEAAKLASAKAEEGRKSIYARSSVLLDAGDGEEGNSGGSFLLKVVASIRDQQDHLASTLTAQTDLDAAKQLLAHDKANVYHHPSPPRDEIDDLLDYCSDLSDGEGASNTRPSLSHRRGNRANQSSIARSSHALLHANESFTMGQSTTQHSFASATLRPPDISLDRFSSLEAAQRGMVRTAFEARNGQRTGKSTAPSDSERAAQLPNSALTNSQISTQPSQPSRSQTRTPRLQSEGPPPVILPLEPATIVSEGVSPATTREVTQTPPAASPNAFGLWKNLVGIQRKYRSSLSAPSTKDEMVALLKETSMAGIEEDKGQPLHPVTSGSLTDRDTDFGDAPRPTAIPVKVTQTLPPALAKSIRTEAHSKLMKSATNSNARGPRRPPTAEARPYTVGRSSEYNLFAAKSIQSSRKCLEEQAEWVATGNISSTGTMPSAIGGKDIKHGVTSWFTMSTRAAPTPPVGRARQPDANSTIPSEASVPLTLRPPSGRPPLSARGTPLQLANRTLSTSSSAMNGTLVRSLSAQRHDRKVRPLEDEGTLKDNLDDGGTGGDTQLCALEAPIPCLNNTPSNSRPPSSPAFRSTNELAARQTGSARCLLKGTVLTTSTNTNRAGRQSPTSRPLSPGSTFGTDTDKTLPSAESTVRLLSMQRRHDALTPTAIKAIELQQGIDTATAHLVQTATTNRARAEVWDRVKAMAGDGAFATSHTEGFKNKLLDSLGHSGASHDGAIPSLAATLNSPTPIPNSPRASPLRPRPPMTPLPAFADSQSSGPIMLAKGVPAPPNLAASSTVHIIDYYSNHPLYRSDPATVVQLTRLRELVRSLTASASSVPAPGPLCPSFLLHANDSAYDEAREWGTGEVPRLSPQYGQLQRGWFHGAKGEPGSPTTKVGKSPFPVGGSKLRVGSDVCITAQSPLSQRADRITVLSPPHPTLALVKVIQQHNHERLQRPQLDQGTVLEGTSNGNGLAEVLESEPHY